MRTDRWLVTGSNGFIGSNFVKLLASKKYVARSKEEVNNLVFPDKVVCLDAMTYAALPQDYLVDFISPVKCEMEFVAGDIRETDLVKYLIEKNNIDVVVNFAAETHVDNSMMRPGSFIDSNVVGVYKLLEAVRACKRRRPRLHHVSTDEVFGSLDAAGRPWTEESPYDPNSPYAATKAAADHLVRSFGKAYGIEYSITHSCNCFGPNQFPEKLIPRAVDTAVKEGKIYVYGSGKQLREWKYVEDNCEDILCSIVNGEPNETYCLGSEVELSVNEVVKMVSDCLETSGAVLSRPFVVEVEDPRGLSQDFRYSMDCSKFKSIVSFDRREYTPSDFSHDLMTTVLSQVNLLTS